MVELVAILDEAVAVLPTHVVQDRVALIEVVAHEESFSP